MKIKSIAKIDNFGIFKNFDWDTHLSTNPTQQNQTYDFKDINIFYGRNYSGKTSLSKIIRALETKTLSPKYENPNFRIKLYDDSEITPSNLSRFQHPIHIYNTDFIKEKLKFIHNESENIDSFTVTLVGDNQQTLDRIQELRSELGTNEENIKTGLFLDIQNKDKDVKDAKFNHESKSRNLEKLLTDKATRNTDSIKNQHLIFGEINYSITKLKQDINSVQDTRFQVLDEKQKTEKKAIIDQKELANPPELSTYNLDFPSLIQSTTQILETVVSSSTKIEELVNNSTLNTWVQTGHLLHNERKTCVFCNNKISDDRREELRQHFDQETQNLQNRILKGIEKLTSLLESENFKISFDINHYYSQYHIELLRLQADLNTILDQQKLSIKQLIALLKQKNGKLFTKLETEYPNDFSEEIKKLLSKIARIRLQCIQLNSELTTKQTEAKVSLRLNHIHHFLQDINYKQLEADKALALETISPLETELTTLQARKSEITAEIKSEEDKLKSEGEACTRINNILNHDFGHQALSLKAIETPNTQNIHFEIQRNGAKAHNLSEGEQSLISFCYFLAKIQDDLEQNKNPIIWIDDPISSLDSNHIFFIFSLIEEKIVADQKFGQLFISTHNLEFLKYLKRLNGKKWGNIQFFIIKRNFDSSAIFQMPIYMKNYFSELNFLFHQLYLCASEENINDQNYNVFYNFPNNARKFLELYSNFHYPDGFSNTDTEKLKSLWGEHLVFTFTDRINNEYSHLAGIFERSFTPLEQPEMNKASFAILKKIIELNPRQYEGFLKSIGIESTTIDPLYTKLTT